MRRQFTIFSGVIVAVVVATSLRMLGDGPATPPAAPIAAGDSTRGLWLLPRKDPQNTARADVAGKMTEAPVEVWAYGGDTTNLSYAVPITLAGAPAYLGQSHSGLRVVRPDGKVVWERATLGVSSVIAVDDFDGDGRPEALVNLGPADIALIDAATGATRWTWSAPAGSTTAGNGSLKVWRHAGGDKASPSAARLIVFPQASLHGICLDLTSHDDKPRIIWDHEYDGYWKNFGPHIVLADMDKDGVPDVVLAGKPGYAAVIDAGDGRVKCDVHYQVTGGPEEGRPYGLLIATDMDGDGFPDIAMLSCQVEEYLSIIHNDGGKKLSPIWSQFIEHDLPDDFRELRPNMTSFADIDGDGLPELVVGLFNETGDNRWHTVVIDPLKGFKARKADLPDRYFWGCYDLDGDGRPEIITSTEHLRRPAAMRGELTDLQAVDGRTRKDLATVKNAALATAAPPPPANAGFMAIRATPRFCRMPDGVAGLLLSTANGRQEQSLWSLKAGESHVRPVQIGALATTIALSSGQEKIEQPDAAIAMPAGDATTLFAATAPLIGIHRGRRELVFVRSDGVVVGGEPDLQKSGTFKSNWTVAGSMPALWIDPAGERVVCTVTADQSVLLSRPQTTSGPAPATAPATTLALPSPIYRNSLTRNGPTLLPFGRDSLRVYVGLQVGVHTMASALFDGSGKMLWADDREGPYPRTAAAADLAGSPTLVVDNHGRHFLYDLQGHHRMLARGWSNDIPGRADGGKYVVPIVGNFGPAGEERLLMSSGLDAIEVLDAAGKRLAKTNFASTYEYEWNGSAVARIRGGEHQWDLAMVNKPGMLTCFDAATAQPRWTLDLGCKATFPINLIAADIDGDGRDNILAGLPDGRLVAIDERDGKPFILWTARFTYGVRDTIVGDVDGDGVAEIVVETEEGRIHVLREKR